MNEFDENGSFEKETDANRETDTKVDGFAEKTTDVNMEAERSANAQPPVNPQNNQRPQYPYSNNYYNPSMYNSRNGSNGYGAPQQPYNGYNQPYNGGYNPGQNPYSYSNGGQNNGYAYQQNNAPEPQKKKTGVKVFIIVAAVLLAVIIIGFILGGGSGGDTPMSADTSTTEEATSLNVNEFVSSATPENTGSVSVNGALAPNAIFEKVKESSVGILVYNSSKALSSEGTGVIMSEDNDGKYTYIVTCAHVISDKNVSIMVQVFSGREYAAQVVGYDAKTDIGVLRIETNGLKAAEYGDSSKLSVGDTIYAIGNPGGTEFANSFTNGMISAIDRPVSSSSTGYTMECIQHTAAINPGNSGGALVNEYGQVIGINSMKIIADEYEGMGFAVPSSVFIEIVNQIIENGYVANRPKLGITYVAASTQQSYAMYVAIKGLPSGSIIIYSISEDSSFVGTDVQQGDMIVSVNGKGLDDSAYLSEVIEDSRVGDEITLGIVRINNDYTAKEFNVTVKLVEDRGDTLFEEETTTSVYEGFFNNGGNGGYDQYEDFFNDFFGRYFNP